VYLQEGGWPLQDSAGVRRAAFSLLRRVSQPHSPRSTPNKRPRVHRVTVAIACGLAVNPLSIEAKCQGAVGFGLTQLMSGITLKDGEVEQSNFNEFRPPYMSDAPAVIDVHIVPSNDAPLGVGETATPVTSPAVVNALARLTGKRYRSLPLTSV